MKMEISSGGIVLVGNAILLLRKYNGDWVLPKGRLRLNETLEQAALREVHEESSVKGEIIVYLGSITYTLNANSYKRSKSEKTVHWYLMSARNMDCSPLRKEGFVDAKYVPITKAIDIARYDDERIIIKKAAEYYNNKQIERE